VECACGGHAVGCGVCDMPELWRGAAGLCARVRACAGAAESLHTYIHHTSQDTGRYRGGGNPSSAPTQTPSRRPSKALSLHFPTLPTDTFRQAHAPPAALRIMRPRTDTEGYREGGIHRPTQAPLLTPVSKVLSLHFRTRPIGGFDVKAHAPPAALLHPYPYPR